MARNCKFLHGADFHLGSPFRGLGRSFPGLAEILASAPGRALKKFVARAVENQVDFVLIAGDVFDDPAPPLRSRLEFVRALEELDAAGIETFIVPGNHDPLPWPETAELPPRVKLFGPEPEAVPVKKAGTVVATVAGMSRNRDTDLESTVGALDALLRKSAGARIGLFHADPGGAAQIPVRNTLFTGTGADYWALGHIHRPGIPSKNPTAVYPGCLQGRAADEPGVRGAYLVEAGRGTEPRLEFLPTSVLRFEIAEIVNSKAETLAELETEIAEAAEKFPLEGELLLRVILSGATKLNAELRHEGEEELRGLLSEMLTRRNPQWYLEDVLVRTRSTASAEAATGLAAEVKTVNALPETAEKFAATFRELRGVFRELPEPDEAEMAAIRAEAADLLTDYLTGDLEPEK